MDTNRKTGFYYVMGGFYICIIFILGAITFLFNRYLAITEWVLGLLLTIVHFLYKKHTQRKIADMFASMTVDIGSAMQNALMNFPLPTLIIDRAGKIKWNNDLFCDVVEENGLLGRDVSSVLPSLNTESFFAEPLVPIAATVEHKDRTFRVFGSHTQSESKQNIVVLYFVELTEYVQYQQKYEDEKTCACLIFVDNYDELMETTAVSDVPQLQAQLYKIINDWVSKHGGVLVKYEKDKYSVLFEQRRIEDFIKAKFDVLADIREIAEGNTIPASISIGIGTGGETIIDNDEFAKNAVNMALGRGGDQAVIKDQDQFSFYGGNSKEYEKSTRVKARVVSNALSGLINNATNVMIMSHKDADADSLGAAFGLYRMCRMQDRSVHIVLESYDQTVRNFLERFEPIEEYAGLFLNVQQALARTDENTLLIVVDTHKPSLVEAPALLKKTEQIVVIDHHRRGTEFIENTVLIYHEPYASSTCEMMTEILQYSSNKLSLTKLEAECLYAGIVVDTKHFTFKTGVRTFEAASLLRKQGVDTVAIKTMFQQDLSSYIKRATIIRDAEVIRDTIAVSAYRELDKNIHITIAQAADELLNIKGITASFVLCKTEEGVSISGRSLGGINVQVILEKLGGGGHLTIAGAQLNDLTIEEAKEQLFAVIEDYYLESVN
ncbi:MAG: phosphoesterase [Ruminococcaceae bacterium]|nr:phosphoesterase [Oscillospiraceae bacterium]